MKFKKDLSSSYVGIQDVKEYENKMERFFASVVASLLCMYLGGRLYFWPNHLVVTHLYICRPEDNEIGETSELK